MMSVSELHYWVPNGESTLFTHLCMLTLIVFVCWRANGNWSAIIVSTKKCNRFDENEKSGNSWTREALKLNAQNSGISSPCTQSNLSVSPEKVEDYLRVI